MKKRTKVFIIASLLVVLALVTIGSYIAAGYFHGINIAQSQRKTTQNNSDFSGDK